MRWPELVPAAACRTPCTVTLEGKTGEDGAPEADTVIAVKCNYQDAPRQIVDAEKRIITLAGCCLFPGELAPGVDVIAGTVTVYGKAWRIYRATRARNPDGTVNFTKLELT